MNESGEIVGSATRGECHSGSKILHPVVHLQIFNEQGDIYLQHRPEWKDIQPNMWDTAVGGHIDFGESVDDALRREAAEELGIVDFEAHFVKRYIFESSVEREMIHTYTTVYNGELHPSTELAGGRFWSRAEIDRAVAEGGILTENFTNEYVTMLS